MGKRTRPRPRSVHRTGFVRRAPPKLEHEGEKLKAILCPFCKPSHPIYVGTPAVCGTILELEAVQVAFRGVKCYVCGQSDGSLIRVGDVYRHAEPCKPGVRSYAVPPKPSRLAGLLWHTPASVHRWLGRTFNRLPTEVKQADGRVYHVLEDATFERMTELASTIKAMRAGDDKRRRQGTPVQGDPGAGSPGSN
jgi:hypothetical protein